ncbi:MAG: arylsulfatase [Prolixibacteraceae bacterium]
MKNFGLIPYVGLGLCCLTANASEKEKQTNDKPNIIYILADDLGYGVVGCYGQTMIKTPNIDKLATEGMLFTQHYAGCTVCAPSRASLMTGLHTGHTPIRGNKSAPNSEGQYPMPADTYTVGKMLREGGYATGCFGKWGLGYPYSEGAPENQGFDVFFGYNCQGLAHSYYPYYLWNNTDTLWLKGNEGTKTGEYSQDIIHQKALQFIKDNKNRNFFACLTYILPHAELVNPKDSIFDMYKDEFVETPFEGIDENNTRYKRGGYISNPHPKADFAAMVTRLDAYVGQVVSLIKELGLDENTLVIFTSDNGPHKESGADPAFFKSSGPLRGIKRDLYEGGIRVPFIARYPGKIKAGSVSDHVCAFWDMMPTFAELTGTKAADNTDGVSFLPTLFGKPGQKEHEFLYWEFHEGTGKMAVRKGDWKAIRLNIATPEKLRFELYDLSKDLPEKNNVAGQYPQIASELNKIMDEAHVPSPVWNFGLGKISKK